MAKKTPARKRNSGAGNVPPSCDHMKNVDWRAAPPSQAAQPSVWNKSTQGSPRSPSKNATQDGGAALHHRLGPHWGFSRTDEPEGPHTFTTPNGGVLLD